MKKTLAIFLAAILLFTCCTSLAENVEKKTAFTVFVVVDAAKFESFVAINGFLAQMPISELQVNGIRYTKIKSGLTGETRLFFDNLSLTGIRYNPYSVLYIYQYAWYFGEKDTTNEMIEAKLAAEHPHAEIMAHDVKNYADDSAHLILYREEYHTD